MIQVQGPDGNIIQFPDGTDDATIDRVMREAYAGQSATPAQPAPERGFMHRLGDNLIGYDDGVQSFGEDVGQWINRGVESGTVGLVGDEAAAYADSMFGRIGDGTAEAPTYDDALAQRRTAERDYAERNPWLAFGADLSGALVPGLGIYAATSKGANLATQMGAGGVSGAATGAVQGFMEGEGGIWNRLANAGQTAAVGGGIGVLVPAVGRLGGAAWERFGPGAQAALREAQDALGLHRAGTEIVSDAIARDAPFAADQLAAAGPNAINAEMGRNTASLMDWVVNRPGGPASGAYAGIEQMAAERGQAFKGTLDELLGDPMGVLTRQADLMDTTRAARRDAYAVPYSFQLDYMDPSQAPFLSELLDRVPSSAMADIQTTMRMDGADIPVSPVWTGGEEVAQRLTPDVEGWDYIARALDDVERRGPILGADAPRQIAAGGLAGDIRATLDDIVPGFREARALGGDVIANRNAIKVGSDLLNMTTDEATQAIGRMTEAERAYARLGMRDYLQEVIDRARMAQTDDNMEIREVVRPVLQLLTSGGETKLRALLGEEATTRLLTGAREAYSAIKLRTRVATGSDTAIRQAWEEVIDRNVPMGPFEALQSGQGFAGASAALARPILGDPAAQRIGRREDVLKSIADVLMQPANNGGMPSPVLQQLPALLAASRQGVEAVERGARGVGSIVAALLANQYAR